MGGYGANNSWATPSIQQSIEVLLRCQSTHLYRGDLVHQTYQECVRARRLPHHQRVGFSYENLSCSLGHDVGLVEKARRLKELLGSDTKVIYVLRRQSDLLVSLYKELLLWGLPVDFTTFIERLVFTNFQGLIADMQFAELLDVYVSLFGKRNVLPVLFTDLQQNSEATLQGISAFLEIEHHPIQFTRVHSSLTAVQAQWLLKENQRNVHDFGRDRFAIWHGERVQSYGNQLWKGWQPNEIEENALIGVSSARKARTVINGIPLQLTLPASLQKRLIECFASTNQRLLEHYAIDLQF